MTNNSRSATSFKRKENGGNYPPAYRLFLLLSLLTAFGLLVMVITPPVQAQEPSYDQINEVAKQLNCPTCAGINLADCRTQTCQQWRDQISDLMAEGYSEQQVLDYFATQYGEQVLQEPPKSGSTLILWVLPVIAILGGGGWLFFTMRRWQQEKTQPPAPETVTPQTATLPAEPQQPPDDYLSQVEKDLQLE